MDDRRAFYRGCLLGLAVGDAMGCAVDEKTWDEIVQCYGPNGLLGYDLVNDSACITSYTQLAAFACNGLLLALSRGKKDYVNFVTLALREWARGQAFPRDPERSHCWVAKLPYMRRKQCRDVRMLDALRAQTLGTPESPINSGSHPGALPEAVAVGLLFDPKYMEPEHIGTLAADLVALTHGDPETFLTGAVLAYTIAGILQEPEQALSQQFRNAAAAMTAQFGGRFPEAEQVAAKLTCAMALPQDNPRIAMESLRCSTAAECLAGAAYASLVGQQDFDAAMIVAVNHSGRSSAVGALTGAILGAVMGDEALPDFYLESLEPLPMLRELADDLYAGSPAASLFNDDWDQKYTQGCPPERIFP